MADGACPTDRLKIVLVGDSSVGKTSIFHLFDTQEVEKKTKTTYVVTMKIKAMVETGNSHRTIQLEVYDTAGEEKLRSITRQFYRGADIAILVFDITRQETFHHIEQYWKTDMIKGSENDGIKVILIGNKTDDYLARQVEQYIVKEYAERQNMVFFEMSAHNPDHFDILCETIRTAVGQVMAEGGSCRYRTTPSQSIQERLVINLPPNEQQPQPQSRGLCSSC